MYPLLLTAIGNVQSLNNVVLKPQISGVLTQVLVHEGQSPSRRGQLLASIDDRPVQGGREPGPGHREAATAPTSKSPSSISSGMRTSWPARPSPARRVDQQRALVEQLNATVQSDAAAVQTAEVQRSYASIVSPVIRSASACAASIRATSCRPTIPTASSAWSRSIRSPCCSLSLSRTCRACNTCWRIPHECPGDGLRPRRRHDPRHRPPHQPRQPDRRRHRHHPAPRRVRRTRTGISGRGSSSPRSCEQDWTAAPTVLNSRAVQDGLDGTFVFRVKNGNGRGRTRSRSATYRGPIATIRTRARSPATWWSPTGQDQLTAGYGRSKCRRRQRAGGQ
jgi:hypothetical protein